MKTLVVIGMTALAALGAQAAGMCASVAPLTAADSETGIGAPRYLPLRWLSLGTSITWYNSHAGGKFEKGYQSWLMEQIKFDGFANRGVSGACLDSTLWCIQDADLYTVEHGINDWGNRVPPGTMADYENNTGNGTFAATYRKVIDKLRATNPKAKIILCTPRKGYGFGGYLPDRCDARQSERDGKPGYFLKDYADLVLDIAEKEIGVGIAVIHREKRRSTFNLECHGRIGTTHQMTFCI